jgi:hypothetical protein
MTASINATLGASDANSYVTMTEADAYAANQPWEATWLTYTEDQKTVALYQGMKWLNTLSWIGLRCDPSTNNADVPQALQWPRHDAACDGVVAKCSFIPGPVKNAQCELAFQFARDPSAIIPDSGGGGGGPAEGVYVKRQKLDVLEIEYEEYAEHSPCNDCGDPPLFREFPWLRSLLSCWYGGVGANRQIRLVRN